MALRGVYRLRDRFCKSFWLSSFKAASMRRTIQLLERAEGLSQSELGWFNQKRRRPWKLKGKREVLDAPNSFDPPKICSFEPPPITRGSKLLSIVRSTTRTVLYSQTEQSGADGVNSTRACHRKAYKLISDKFPFVSFSPTLLYPFFLRIISLWSISWKPARTYRSWQIRLSSAA
jgi:hypothetical protein